MTTTTSANEMPARAAAFDTEYRNHLADYRADVHWLNANYVPTNDELAEDCTPPDIIAQRVACQRAEDTRNAAKRAHARGVRILVEPRFELHIAVDDLDSPCAWFVTETPPYCSCQRFALFRRCDHLALLLAELGAIPEHDAPGCLACEGDGCPSCRLLAA